MVGQSASAPLGGDLDLNALKVFVAVVEQDGFRGAQAADLDRLAEIVVRLSEFIADQRDGVAELDVNPIIVAGAQAVAVDALIVRR